MKCPRQICRCESKRQTISPVSGSRAAILPLFWPLHSEYANHDLAVSWYAVVYASTPRHYHTIAEHRAQSFDDPQIKKLHAGLAPYISITLYSLANFAVNRSQSDRLSTQYLCYIAGT